jgi:hypothetical protein
MTQWTIERTDRHAHRIQYRMTKTNGIVRLLVLSDLHWDNAWCRRDILKRDLDQALQTNTPVLIAGDLFDAMQGKWDPRKSQDQLRPEHRGGNYLDLLVNTAAKWFAPYAPVLALVGQGNHETNIMNRHEINLLERFVTLMRAQHNSPVELGDYWGYLLLQVFNVSGNSATKTVHYHHGYGGGGEITRGMIDQSRTRSQYDADVFVSGHIHRRNSDENILTRVSDRGQVYTVQQLFLRCGAYKEEDSGWHCEKGRAGRPVGGWWVELAGHKPGHGEQRNFEIKAMRALST